MRPRQDFHFAKEGGNNGFARFMIVLGYRKVMPSSLLIQMALVILEKMCLKTRGMKNNGICKKYLYIIKYRFRPREVDLVFRSSFCDYCHHRLSQRIRNLLQFKIRLLHTTVRRRSAELREGTSSHPSKWGFPAFPAYPDSSPSNTGLQKLPIAVSEKSMQERLHLPKPCDLYLYHFVHPLTSALKLSVFSFTINILEGFMYFVFPESLIHPLSFVESISRQQHTCFFPMSEHFLAVRMIPKQVEPHDFIPLQHPLQ